MVNVIFLTIPVCNKCFVIVYYSEYKLLTRGQNPVHKKSNLEQQVSDMMETFYLNYLNNSGINH